MHKSTIPHVSLFLIGTLIMLVPFTSINFSNVKAQEYYKFKQYNEYPTKDYKYECRTGPFEGFFVSSVEFCLVDEKKKDRPIVEPPIPPTTPPTTPPPTSPPPSQGTTLYVTNQGDNTVEIYDISTPTAPVLIDTI
jgi:hypothetical protein